MPTTMDVLVAISDLSTNMDTRFDRLEGRVNNLEGDMRIVKSTMVTKDYLDRKFHEHKDEFHSRQIDKPWI